MMCVERPSPGRWSRYSPRVRRPGPKFAFAVRKEDTYGLQNRVRLLWDAAAYFERLVARIDSAREVVHFQVYILANDHTGHLVMDALERVKSA